MKHSLYIFSVVFVALALCGCKAPSDIAYFQDMQELQAVAVQQANIIKAKPQDRLTIVVKSKDYELAELFNLSIQASRVGSGSSSRGSNSGMEYYTVDERGNVEMPIIGSVHVEGMTRTEIAAHVRSLIIASGQLLDPHVTVEFISMQFSVLGEVRSPGEYVYDRDRLTILQAISRAGDLQITGERKNVSVIRMEDGQEKHYFVDLTNAESLYQSPVFYIQPDDVVYVAPNAKRMRESRPNGNTFNTVGFWTGLVGTVSSITSIAVTVATRAHK